MNIYAEIKQVPNPHAQAVLTAIAAKTDEMDREVVKQLGSIAEDAKSWNPKFQKQREATDELSARLVALEQHVVSGNYAGNKSNAYCGGPSFGDLAMQAAEDSVAAPFSSLREWNAGTCRINLQASIRAALTNDGKGSSSDTSVARQPEQRGFVSEAGRPVRLLEALPSRPTNRDSVQFVQLNSTGDAAEQEREGDEKAEIDIDGTPQMANIVTVAAHTTASRQVLSDHAALQGAIDLMIRNKLLSRLEHQLVNGAGGEGKINGLLNQAVSFIPTIGTTPADIIGESLTRQADRGYLPGLVVMNPLDWFRLQITKKSAGDEEYIFGSPTMPLPPALWNVRVVATPSMPEGEAITMDTAFVTVLDREQPSVLLSNSHKDYFTRNLVLILGELRAGLEVLDAFAIYKMNLTSSGA